MHDLHEDKLKLLEEKASRIRYNIIEAIITAESGHIAGPLGMTDIFTALYFHVLKHDPKRPDWSERDRVILSNGHICPVLYAAMAESGYFPVEELKTLRKFGSRLQGHPHREFLPALESSSGPLGSGLSQATGMAIGLQMDGLPNQVYAFLSDGELECGQTWEAAMLAGKHKLNNLTMVIDRNNIQIDGMTEDIMPLEPLRDKFEAFNWHVLEVNGHDFHDIINGFETARAIYEKPVCIIAHTIPGKGVSFMEFKYPWHSKSFSKEEAKTTLDELRTLGGKITSEHQ